MSAAQSAALWQRKPTLAALQCQCLGPLAGRLLLLVLYESADACIIRVFRPR
jgi:hypothetical protein